MIMIFILTLKIKNLGNVLECIPREIKFYQLSSILISTVIFIRIPQLYYTLHYLMGYRRLITPSASIHYPDRSYE